MRYPPPPRNEPEGFQQDQYKDEGHQGPEHLTYRGRQRDLPYEVVDQVEDQPQYNDVDEQPYESLN